MLASKKTIAYINRMINIKHWKINEKIPTIKTISTKLNVSCITVRKAIGYFEHKKIIQNCGYLGFFVLSDTLVKTNKLSRTNLLAHFASFNFNLSTIDHFNIKLFGCYGIKVNENSIDAINILTHKRIRTSIEEISDIINNPITVNDMLNISDIKTLERVRSKYQRQIKLEKLAKTIYLRKKELGDYYG